MNQDTFWIALNIGNSRLHWACFAGQFLKQTWEAPHLLGMEAENLVASFYKNWPDLSPGLAKQLSNASQQLPELWLASVVPAQTVIWQSYPKVKIITLNQVPLKEVYLNLGVDRALAVWGAGEIWGWPVLVIDAGTALTFTGADQNHRLVGGAILPGLGLQVRSLAEATAGLPLIELSDSLPTRWAISTAEAIRSGTIYTLLAGIHDFVTTWYQQFPESQIVITGGDRLLLLNYLKAWLAQKSQTPEWLFSLIDDSQVIFKGIQFLRQSYQEEAQKLIS